MSNQLRKTRKGDRPGKDKLNQRLNNMEQHMQQMQNVLVNTMYSARYATANHNNFVNFLIEKKIITEADYNAYLQEIKRKSDLAQEIMKDDSLSPEEKIVKAKENDIPEEWVKESAAETEDGVAEEKEDEPSGRIITP